MSRTGVLAVSSFQRLAAPEAKRRQRKCVICRTPFEPRSMKHKACGADCALAHAVAERARRDAKVARADRVATKQALEALRPKSYYLKVAQAAFNAFIRARDAALPCISCGRFHKGSYDAGHYRSVGAMPALRFHELNVHRQCVPCNQHRAGNIVEYRLGLVARIGVTMVEWLETDHPPAKYTIEEAKAITTLYRAKLKEIIL